MKGVASEHVVDVVAPLRAMMEVEGFLRFLAMFTPTLTMVEAMKSALRKLSDKVAELVPP